MIGEHKSKKQCLLVDLEALVDTKIGVIATISEAEAVSVIESDWCTSDSSRVYDFCSVTKEAFEEAWAARDAEALSLSRPTGLVKEMIGVLTLTEASHSMRPMLDEPEVHINIYPYRLDGDVQEELLYSLHELWGTELRITLTYISPAELSPSRLVERYAAWYNSDFNGWYSLHSAALMVKCIPSFLMFAASVYLNNAHERVLSPLEIKEAKDAGFDNIENISHFGLIESRMIEVLDIAFLPVSFFKLH